MASIAMHRLQGPHGKGMQAMRGSWERRSLFKTGTNLHYQNKEIEVFGRKEDGRGIAMQILGKRYIVSSAGKWEVFWYKKTLALPIKLNLRGLFFEETPGRGVFNLKSKPMSDEDKAYFAQAIARDIKDSPKNSRLAQLKEVFDEFKDKGIITEELLTEDIFRGIQPSSNQE